MWLFSSPIVTGRSSPSATPSSAVNGHGDASLPLELRLIRVSEADISRVTADDVKRVRARLTKDELTTSLRLMGETNRIADVIASASPSAWAEAAAGVTEAQMGLSDSVMRDRMSLLYNMLSSVSDRFLDAMGSPYASDH
ncbi:hypothetical protein GH5_07731 [Leishmania sp. Ghana 2012 LV757]|uniref:hypothetical protein n=1 Tax=Leishmania sp. Ghana 2012 LV757 TaxID=2803181 RepID=UPI001B4733F8|nr:hypothetical protein GH5_07731 [Leishmania sp. Ghana 2012 LV757]